MRIGHRVAEIRKSVNMKQNKFAESIGLKTSNLNQIENGKYNPTLETIVMICETYGVSADFLIFGKKEKKGHSVEQIITNSDNSNINNNSGEIIKMLISENAKMKDEQIRLQNKIIEILETKKK
ncbi:MAG: helix-turn-helix domain-containing protein [Candidatus Cloacimonetes bacterium]|nr:helix-turn-helix domain-containing protein [Candidatus Cloacimonadota bacterium]